MKRKFTVYASKHTKKPIKCSADILHNLWVAMTDSDQYAVEYANAYLDSNYNGVENATDDQLESAANYGCNIIGEGNAEPEYADEDFYMDEADFDAVFNYLKAKRDDRLAITGSCDIEASEGYRDDNDWLLKPGNQWYAVASYYDYGDAESGPMVDGDWIVYQASSPEEAEVLCKADYPNDMIGEVRLATPDEIEEYYYIMSEGQAPDHIDSTETGNRYSYGGLITDEEEIV